jgi:PKD repeat protein
MARTFSVAIAALLCVTSLAAAEQDGAIPSGQAVTASRSVWRSVAVDRSDGLAQLVEPVPLDRSPNASLEQWLDHVGVGRVQPQPEGLDTEAEEAALGNSSTLGLVGSNLPICTYRDDVSNTESLEKSSIAYNSNAQQYLVAWHALSRTTDFDVFGRITSVAGATSGAIFVITQDAGMQVAASVAYDYTAGQYFVTWSDFGTGSTGAVRLRRFSNAGAPIGSVITVNAAGTNAYASRVACGGGRCVIVWVNDLGNGTSQVLARSYDSSGSSKAGPVVLSDTSVVGFPDIACNYGGSHFLVTWEQAVSGWWDIIGVGLTNALALSPRVSVSAASGNQRYPRVGYTPGTASYLVAWQDGRSMANWDIWGQRVSSSFALSGSNFNIYSGTFSEYNPAVAGLDTTSQFAVVFATDTNGGGLLQIHGTLVSGFGGVVSQFSVRDWNNLRRNPAVAGHLGASDYLITWTDDGQMTTADILGRVVKSDGNPAGSHVAIARGRKGQEFPTLAFSPAHNEYLVVWMDYRNGSDYQIWGRRVSATGSTIGNEFAIGNEGSSILYGLPAVAYNTNTNEYLVVWHEIHSQATGYDVYARRVGWNGTLPALPFLVSRDSGAGNEGTPRVAYNSTANEFLVGWNAFDDKGSLRWRVWGQRVSAGGTLSGSGFLTSSSSGSCSPPRLASNSPANQYLAIWQDFRDAKDNIYGQRVNGNGTLAGGNFAISASTGSNGGFAPAWGGSGYYLVVWGDTRSGTNIYGQRVAGNGVLSGTDFPVANSSSLVEINPAVAADRKTGGFLVGWQQPGATTDTDLWARRVPSSGAPTDASFPLTTAVDIQSYVEIEQDTTSGQLLSVWQDFRAGSYDVYGQLYSPCTLACTATVPATGTKGVAVAFASTGTATGCSGSVSYDWDYGDGSAHGTTQNPSHTYTTAKAYTWRLTVSVAGGVTCSKTGTITISGPTICTLNCSASVAATGSVNVPLTFSGSAVVGGCSSPVTYDWDYGDNSTHGNTQDVSHTYMQGGTFYWRMTATAGTATCVQNGTVQISGTRKLWVPVVSHAGGYVGGWRSDLGILNRSTSDAAKVSLTVHTTGRTLTGNVTVPAKGQEILRDVAGLLGLDSGSGSLELSSDQPVIVTSRTYNLQENGWTFGQGYDGIGVWEGLAAGQSAFIPQLTQNGSSGQTGTYRSNIGITNLGTVNARVTLELFEGQGGHLWSNTRDIAAGQWYQYNEPFRTGASRNNIAKGYGRITVNSGTSVFAYGSVLDNGSSDPTTIVMRQSPPQSASGQSVSWVPVVSRAGGYVGGWRSDVGILNRSGTGTAALNLVLRASGRTLNGSITVQNGGQEILRDAAQLLGLESGSGSLEIVADRPVIVTSRTYNLQESGWTYGQGYDGLVLADGLTAGQSAFLPQLTQNGASGQVGTYRTNIGVTNMGSVNANITLILYDGLGNQVYSNTRGLTPGQWYQYNEPYRLSAQRNDIAKGYAKITINSGSSVIAYASVIDNGSSDPTTIMMRR